MLRHKRRSNSGRHSHMVPPSFSWTRMAHKTKAQKLRHRQSLQVWYPRESDLRLPDVPPGERAEVRQILSRCLGDFPVRAGTCWQTAQALTLLSRDSRVSYVEGVSWNVKRTEAGGYAPMFPHDGECISSICVCKPLPHAWNLVNGHVVDLLAEFYNWRFGSDYLHELMKVYTLEDMRVGGVPANFSIVQKVWMEQHQREPESMAATCQHVFKEAIDRLLSLDNRGSHKNGPR